MDRIGRPKSGGERDSLIRAEISLIADLNSLQGRKKSLFEDVFLEALASYAAADGSLHGR